MGTGMIHMVRMNQLIIVILKVSLPQSFFFEIRRAGFFLALPFVITRVEHLDALIIMRSGVCVIWSQWSLKYTLTIRRFVLVLHGIVKRNYSPWMGCERGPRCRYGTNTYGNIHGGVSRTLRREIRAPFPNCFPDHTSGKLVLKTPLLLASRIRYILS